MKLYEKTAPIALNLSAIAKGYAVDKVATLLDEQGFLDYMINIGGEIKTKGRHDSEKWQIGIQYPARHLMPGVKIDLENKAMATSGNYNRYYIKNATQYAHIINPKTNTPITNNNALTSATVIDDSCMVADAYATALMAMGYEKAVDFIEKNVLRAILIINITPHQEIPTYRVLSFL